MRHPLWLNFLIHLQRFNQVVRCSSSIRRQQKEPVGMLHRFVGKYSNSKGVHICKYIGMLFHKVVKDQYKTLRAAFLLKFSILVWVRPCLHPVVKNSEEKKHFTCFIFFFWFLQYMNCGMTPIACVGLTILRFAIWLGSARLNCCDDESQPPAGDEGQAVLTHTTRLYCSTSEGSH